MEIPRAVVRDVEKVAGRIPARTWWTLRCLERLRTTVDLVNRLLSQTRAHILRDQTPSSDKVEKFFEPGTEVIRKGKAAKPTEFGEFVKIQEAEAQLITDYEVRGRRVPGNALWGPSLERHEQLFGRTPHLAAADAAFRSRVNE